jgi:hypothetical protein
MATKTTPTKSSTQNVSADVLARQQEYSNLGLQNATNYKSIQDLEKALIQNVYKLNPSDYAVGGKFAPTVKGQTYNLEKAAFEAPKITKPESEPKSFTQAISNYTNAIKYVGNVGAENINKTDLATLNSLARSLRDFDSKDLSESAKFIISNAGDAVDAINAIKNQQQSILAKENLLKGLDENGKPLSREISVDRKSESTKLITLRDEYQRLVNTANQATPRLEESLTRFGLSDISSGIGSPIAEARRVNAGLSALGGDQVFGTGAFQGRPNINVTDDQIINDINTARKNQYKNLYDIGTSAVTDLQSQLSTATSFLSDLPAGDRRRADAQKTIDNLNKELSQAQADTLQARNLYENYQPVSGTQAQSAISSFRESLRLPEERTMQQIEAIDPQMGRTVRALSSQYAQMAKPLGATTTPQTEELRNTLEQEALNQLRLGSTLGAEERRGYEQAIRQAQTARGNIAGLGPAVQEAANIGAAGEQRKLARYGAAASFLGSGETTGAAAARDLGLRNALEQSRLGAAAGFVAGGPNIYNLASQRLGQQQAMLGQYLAAAQPQQTPGFQSTPSSNIPYAYVNPMAGFQGAQNAASIYNTLSNYQSQTYGDYTRAQASQPGFAQNFGAIASGIGSLIPNISV